MPDSPSTGKPFEIGFVMAGAISAGAYSAGVLDFLVEALDPWGHASGRDAAARGRVEGGVRGVGRQHRRGHPRREPEGRLPARHAGRQGHARAAQPALRQLGEPHQHPPPARHARPAGRAQGGVAPRLHRAVRHRARGHGLRRRRARDPQAVAVQPGARV